MWNENIIFILLKIVGFEVGIYMYSKLLFNLFYYVMIIVVIGRGWCSLLWCCFEWNCGWVNIDGYLGELVSLFDGG